MATERSMEIRARRTLARRGYVLEKNRRRDPAALDYGTYQVLDNYTTRNLVFPREGTATLADVLIWIAKQESEAAKLRLTAARAYKEVQRVRELESKAKRKAGGKAGKA